MLKTCSQCGGSFELGTQFCPRDGTALTMPAGLIAGKYQLLGELGSGGMAVVYLATHVSMNRRCALKMIAPGAVSATDALSRFHREAQSASRISHPNVVSVFDFGTTEDGTPYLAMEYVEGQSLEQIIAAGPLGPRRMARMIWQVANGLSAAHELGIVHRDLKPANIMITRYRSWDDFVKVVDFGIAKPVGTAATSTVTSTGFRVGTPAYMSPEQWIDGNVDHRSDIYSLGLIAVELLSGQRANAVPGSMAGGPTLPAEWPSQVRAVLARATAPLPENRYESVSAFAAALVAAVNAWAPPTPGVREPWDERLGTTGGPASGRRRIPVMVAVGSALGLLVAAWVAWDAASLDPPPVVQPTPASVTAPDSAAAPDDRTGGRDKTPTREPGLAPNPGTRVLRAPAPAVDSFAIIRSALDLDRPDPDSARRVAGIAAELLRGRLTDSTRLEVTYRLAEARFVLGDAVEACLALDSIVELSQRVGYLARSVAALRDRRC